MVKHLVQGFFEVMKKRHEVMLRAAPQSTDDTPLTWQDSKVVDHLSGDEWQRFNEDLEEQIGQKNDRSVVVLSHSFLDDRLRWLHEVNMVTDLTSSQKRTLFRGTGPLSSYKARCDIAYALGLVKESFHKELALLGEIRNKFAHDFRRVKLDDPKISALCVKLGHYVDDATPIPTSDPRMHYAAHCFISMTVLFTIGQAILARRQTANSPVADGKQH